MKRIALACLCGLLLSTAVTRARAAFPLALDDASVTAVKDTEVVFASDTLSARDSHLQTATWSLTTGVLPRLEASLDSGWGWLKTADDTAARGLLDLNLGLKALVIGQPGKIFSMTFAGSWKCPTASSRSDLGSGQSDYTTNLACTWVLGRVSLDLNAGYTWIGVTGPAKDSLDQTHAGMALRWQATPRWLFFNECIGRGGTRPTRQALNLVTRTGAQYALNPHWLLGVAVGRDFYRENPATMTQLGITILR